MVTLQNLSEEVDGFIRKNGLVQSQTFADEHQASLQPALNQVIALVAKSLTELAGQASGREVVWNAACETSDSPPLATGRNQAALVPQRGVGLVKAVLDDRYHGTISAMAKTVGMKTATISQLIDIATTATFELLGGLAAQNHWNAQQLSEFLRPNRPAVVFAESRLAPVPSSPAPAGVAGATSTSSTTSWLAGHTHILLAVVSLVAVAELGYIMITRPAYDKVENAVAIEGAELPTSSGTAAGQYTAIPVVSISATPAAAKAVVPIVLKLKDGLRQVIGASSTESKLYQFLIDPSQDVDRVDPTKGWIGFDRIYFETNKAALTNESLWQLSNVASILKRFPGAKIKVGGYTDSTGNPINNLRLSKARAEAAKSSLVSLGVPADRLTAMGYGALDNITTNKTEEGRALNRRVSLQVTEK